MKNRVLYKYIVMPIVLFIITVGCSTTKNLKENEYLLSKNIIVIKSKNVIKGKGEIKDNLLKLEVQRPNSFSWLLQSPRKLLYYNLRYKKFHNLPDSSLPKSAERPVIFDSTLIPRSSQNMKNYLFNLGYFYVKIKDTFYYKNQKAYVKHFIYPGKNYKINNVSYDVDDSSIAKILRDTKDQSAIQKDKEYSISVIDEERSRIVSAIRNRGYYHFSQENIITFQLDTFNKTLLKDVVSPVKKVINFITNSYSYQNPSVDVNIEIRRADDSTAYNKYTISNVNVYPDFSSIGDQSDSTLINKTINNTIFHYHEKYVNAKILSQHIFLSPGNLYSQEDYDKTLAKLNELGIFKYIRIVFSESPNQENALDCNIYMNKTKKYDFTQNDELSNGTTYDLGISAGLNFHNKNFLKGANKFTLSLNGGFEYSYVGNSINVFNNFKTLTEYYGLNTSIDFPKFISPIAYNAFNSYNLPHTIISAGSNLIDRLDYFRLVNTSVNYMYNWRKSKNVTWTFSPVFFNIISMPYETQAFIDHLNLYPFLKNSYKPNFIEGENISFTFNNNDKKHNKNYSYIRLSFEESGSLLGVINNLGVALNDLFSIKYAQYSKFDFDARQFFAVNHSTVALRFWGGLGIPYGQSNTLPYIKQYFEGGPYSLRGWQIRSIGPGSFYDSSNIKNTVIDRTGDLKLEFNGEYRFPIAPLFAGAFKLNGAFFIDAGNIWLAKRDTSFTGGEFEINTLGKCIAVDIGAGARFDIATFLTLRIDVAMPIKKPNIDTHNGWVFDQVDFGNSAWRNNNLVVNIAIGYPF